MSYEGQVTAAVSSSRFAREPRLSTTYALSPAQRFDPRNAVSISMKHEEKISLDRKQLPRADAVRLGQMQLPQRVPAGIQRDPALCPPRRTSQKEP